MLLHTISVSMVLICNIAYNNPVVSISGDAINISDRNIKVK